MSILKRAVQDYLELRRGLGFKLEQPGRWLAEFVAFLEQQGADYVTTGLAVQWAMKATRARPDYWASRLGAVRLFAQHHSATDPRTEIPPLGLLPHRHPRRSPYIYSVAEIQQLLAEAKRLPPLLTGLRPSTYVTLLGLLAVTGLRISEALALDKTDVDLAQGVLTVRRTKFDKTRLVPVHATTRDALASYSSRRDQAFRHPITPAFFVSERGSRAEESCVRRTFYTLSRKIGLRGLDASHGPRLHDFRHAFAVRTVLHWYQSGANVDAQMPTLSTYLGHGHVSDTYWYLSCVPELLRLAVARIDDGGDLS